ncbi:hypothetical protein Ahy_B08g092106 isoform A [Arachis hypogaea]|uniref:Uncharacterized protein n=1 Tax=Arachis hypogaea TaxID=3818 RepID=A0A444Y395_ARAHY|nr:hypothetical protein Ahy_B08g092106 isoform A [Arachis hypogaea]
MLRRTAEEPVNRPKIGRLGRTGDRPSPSIVAAVSGGQRHRRRLVLSPSNPPSSPGSLPSSPPSPSSSSSQHQQAVAFHLCAVINTISSSSSSRGPQQSTPEAFHRPQREHVSHKICSLCILISIGEIDADLYQSGGGSNGLYAASLILLLNRFFRLNHWLDRLDQ